MAQSNYNQERRPTAFPSATVYNLPVLSDRFDRFCTKCHGVIEHLALEKYPNQKCPECLEEVEFLDKADGLYRRCVRCSVFVRCIMRFCYMCGRENIHYDPAKPTRMQKVLKAKVREEVVQELNYKRAKMEADDLSKSCLEDGNFEVEPVDEMANKDGHKNNNNNENNETTESDDKKTVKNDDITLDQAQFTSLPDVQ